MNRIEKSKILSFFGKNREAVQLYSSGIIRDSALEDGEWLKSEEKENENINDFILKNLDVIDFKKLVLMGVYCAKLVAKSHNSPEYKLLYINFLEFARENISEKDNITLFLVTRKNRTDLLPVNSKKELYGKPFEEKYIKLDSMFSELIGALEITDCLWICKERNLCEKIAETLAYNTLRKMGYDENKILNELLNGENANNITGTREFRKNFLAEKELLFSIPEIKSRINEDNLYAISGYSYIDRLKDSVLNYKEYMKNSKIEEAKGSILPLAGLKKVDYLFMAIEETIIPSKITIQEEDDKGNLIPFKFSLQSFIEEKEEVFSDYAEIYISENPSQLYNVDVLSFLKKDKAISYIEQVPEEFRGEYYFLLYQANVLSYTEAMDKIGAKDLPQSEQHYYSLRATVRYLTRKNNISVTMMQKLGLVEVNEDEYKPTEGTEIEIHGDAVEESLLNEIKKPEVMFTKTLTDIGLYQVLDDELKVLFGQLSFEQIIANSVYKDIALKNLNVLISRGDLGKDFFKTLYAVYDVSISEIENIVGKDNVRNSFTPEDLLNAVKEINESLEKGVNTEKEKQYHEIIVKEYEYLKEVYNRYGYLHDGKSEERIMDLFDDLIFDEEIFRKLYLDGFVSGKTLYDLNSDLATKIYEEGLLRDEDKRYYILQSGTELKAGDLIRLNQDNIFSNQDVFNLYMQGKIELDTLVTFGEGTNFNEVFKDEDLLKIVKSYYIIKTDEVKDRFNRYLLAYIKFKKLGRNPQDTSPIVDTKVQDKIYRIIGGRYSRKEDLIDLYSKEVLSINTINPDDDLLVMMIKQGKLRADDEELLFRDTEETGRKYLRLLNILRRLDNDDQKLNLLAGVYKVEDNISATRLNLLVNEFSDAFNEEEKIIKDNEQGQKDKVKIGTRQKGNSSSSNGQKAVRSLAKMFEAFKSIKPNYEHILVSGTYIVFLDNSALVEQVFRESAYGKEFANIHATYVISEDFMKHYLQSCYSGDFRKEVYDMFVDINRAGKPYFRWQMITTARRKNAVGINKVNHTENWARNLKNKAGYGKDVDEQELNECLDYIDVSSQTIGQDDFDDFDDTVL